MIGPALRSTLPLLRCPHGGDPLGVTGSGLGCAAGHRFDVARQGYVNLLAAGTPLASDTAAMVAAREKVLDSGRYAPIAAALVAAVSGTSRAGAVLDLGGGTGYYAARVLHSLPDAVGVSLDLSKFAARRAARAHPALASVVADAWAPLPLRDEAFDVVLSVFAPRNVPEIARVLRPGGRFVVVTPEPEHLAEVSGALDAVGVDPRKQDRLEAALGGDFERAGSYAVREALSVSHPEATDLMLMGPAAFHRDEEQVRAALADLTEPLAVTLSVTVQAFVRR